MFSVLDEQYCDTESALLEHMQQSNKGRFLFFDCDKTMVRLLEVIRLFL